MSAPLFLFVVALLTTGLALLWATLLRRSRALYLRRIGRYDKARNVVPYVSHSEARGAAAKRRQRIESALREAGDRGVVFNEFVEVPPALGALTDRLRGEQRFEGDESEPFWHTALLSIQLESDQHLLVERVTDAVVCLERLGMLSRTHYPSNIRLERIPRAEADRFPWRVVIATNHPSVLEGWFWYIGMRDWAGIGIDLVPAGQPLVKRPREDDEENEQPNPTALPFGACRVGDDGMYGVVAGVVQDGNEEYGVTCRHVISSHCAALSWPRPVHPPTRIYTRRSPDAAFINLRHVCQQKGFCFAQPTRWGVPVAPLNQAAIVMAADNGSELVKSPAAGRTRGVVLAAHVSDFKLGDYSYRGAHVLIAPRFYKQYLLTWPLSGRFSVAGDSGSWVLDEATGAWLGMIVGGAENSNTQTYAVAADYVLRAFRLFRQSKSQLTPKLFSER